MSDAVRPFVSVIIPVFNDSERLRTCLRALSKQTYPGDRYEVVVVDNGSDESPAKMQGEFPGVVYAFEPRPGSYAARNKGIGMAKGEILAFTDSDCIPARDWLEKGVTSLLMQGRMALVYGSLDFFFSNPNRPTAVELFDSIRNFQLDASIKKVKCGVTANLLTFKPVFEHVGLFDDAVKSGGDIEWGQRAFAAGYPIIYAHDVRVAHPARRSLREIYKKIVRVIGGLHDLNSRGVPLHQGGFLKELALDLAPPVRFIYRISSDNRVKGFVPKSQVVLVFLFEKYVRAWERLRLQFGGTSRR